MVAPSAQSEHKLIITEKPMLKKPQTLYILPQMIIEKHLKEINQFLFLPRADFKFGQKTGVFFQKNPRQFYKIV